MPPIQYIVEGGQRLSGTIEPSGNKNSALPIIAAALLTEHPVTLDNVPRIRDTETLVELVRSVGEGDGFVHARGRFSQDCGQVVQRQRIARVGGQHALQVFLRAGVAPLRKIGNRHLVLEGLVLRVLLEPGFGEALRIARPCSLQQHAVQAARNLRAPTRRGGLPP